MTASQSKPNLKKSISGSKAKITHIYGKRKTHYQLQSQQMTDQTRPQEKLSHKTHILPQNTTSTLFCEVQKTQEKKFKTEEDKNAGRKLL